MRASLSFLLLLLFLFFLHLSPSFDVIQFVLVSIFLHRRLSIQLPSSLFVFYLPGMGTVNGPCWKKRSEIEIQTETRTVVNFYNGLHIPTEQRYTRFLPPPPLPFSLSFFFSPIRSNEIKNIFLLEADNPPHGVPLSFIKRRDFIFKEIFLGKISCENIIKFHVIQFIRLLIQTDKRDIPVLVFIPSFSPSLSLSLSFHSSYRCFNNSISFHIRDRNTVSGGGKEEGAKSGMDGETRTKRRKMEEEEEEEEEKRGKKEDRYEFQRLSDHSDLYVCSTIDCILSIMFNATLYSTDIGRLRLLSARGGLFSFLFFSLFSFFFFSLPLPLPLLLRSFFEREKYSFRAIENIINPRPFVGWKKKKKKKKKESLQFPISQNAKN